MKNFVKVTLAFFVAAVLIIALLVGVSFYRGRLMDQETKEIASRDIREIVNSWSEDVLIDKSSSGFKVQLNGQTDRISKFFSESRGLGKLTAFGDPKGQSGKIFDPAKGIVYLADYVSLSKFENGDARIEISLVWEDDSWKIYKFGIGKMVSAK
jgi:hypothetical protein